MFSHCACQQAGTIHSKVCTQRAPQTKRVWPAVQVAVLRLLQQLSQVYSVMRVASLAALVPFFTFGEVEQLIVDAVKHNYLHVRPAPGALSTGPRLRVVMYCGGWRHVEFE